MIIERTVQTNDIKIQVSIALTPVEQRKAYEESQRNYRLEDISNHLNDMNEDDLSGYTAEEVAGRPKLMGAILQSFFKHESCELPENDVMDECIRTVLAEQGLRDRKVVV